MKARSDKRTLHGLWAESPKVGDLPVGSRFIATDCLIACEVVGMPHVSSGREWIIIPCEFEGTVSEMIAMGAESRPLPIGMIFKETGSSREFVVKEIDGERRFCIKDGKERPFRSNLDRWAALDRWVCRADDYQVGSGGIDRQTGTRYVIQLDSDGCHAWVPRDAEAKPSTIDAKLTALAEQVKLPAAQVKLPAPPLIQVDVLPQLHECGVDQLFLFGGTIYQCTKDHDGCRVWVKIASSVWSNIESTPAPPEPALPSPPAGPVFSVYALWAEEGWKVLDDWLSADEAEARRVELLHYEAKDGEDMPLAIEVFPVGHRPQQLGVPPKEIP